MTNGSCMSSCSWFLFVIQLIVPACRSADSSFRFAGCRQSLSFALQAVPAYFVSGATVGHYVDGSCLSYCRWFLLVLKMVSLLCIADGFCLPFCRSVLFVVLRMVPTCYCTQDSYVSHWKQFLFVLQMSYISHTSDVSCFPYRILFLFVIIQMFFLCHTLDYPCLSCLMLFVCLNTDGFRLSNILQLIPVFHNSHDACLS